MNSNARFSFMQIFIWHRPNVGLDQNGKASMDQSTIYFSIFVVLVSMVAMIRIYGTRTGRIQVAHRQTQTMCPSCHCITARSKTNCLNCGEPWRIA
jgi:ABC-type branched-subunit amino acid transport system permease subunit